MNSKAKTILDEFTASFRSLGILGWDEECSLYGELKCYYGIYS